MLFHLRTSKTTRPTGLLFGGGLLALFVLTIGTSGATAGTAPTLTGERDKSAGPIKAPVDAAHATPAAARRALLTHQHAETRARPSTTTAAMSKSGLDPAVFGRWTTLSYSLPLRAIHVTLLHTGNFLLIAGSGNVANDNVIGNFKAYLWNPSTGAMTSVPVPYDAFCGGHLVDANGDVIVFGGTVKYGDANNPYLGSNKVYKFVVATNTWVRMPPMKQGRWYPTALEDGHNRFLAYSGRDATGAVPATPEMYDPGTGTWAATAPVALPLYPGLHLLADGRIAYSGTHYGNSGVAPMMLDPTSGAQVRVGDPSGVMDLAHRNSAMSAIVGSADNQRIWVAGGGFPAVKSTYFMNMKAPSPVAVAGPNLPAAKGYVSVSQLPDLTALETGGGTGTDSPVYEASILDPGTSTLSPMAPPTVPRTYHSSSLTMADGRVVTFGGDPSSSTAFELRVEVFSPPYLFKGPRPRVTSKPTEVRYGASYTIKAAAAHGATLGSAVLMRPGSATHSMDANQRVLKLTTQAASGGIRITLPINHNLAPPGWYLLFINDSVGRPSVGQWVHLL